jgi:hypothetical protein
VASGSLSTGPDASRIGAITSPETGASVKASVPGDGESCVHRTIVKAEDRGAATPMPARNASESVEIIIRHQQYDRSTSQAPVEARMVRIHLAVLPENVAMLSGVIRKEARSPLTGTSPSS